MFKGYIRTDGKIPQQKYENEDLLSQPPENCDYAGVLSDEYILIDIDEQDKADILKTILEDKDIACNILKTMRGMHFYFINTGVTNRSVKSVLPISIKCDVGLGSKNTIIPLRVNGRNRRWISKVDEVDDLPSWLTPMKIRFIDFSQMGNGDGRNQELFNYILKLQTGGLNKFETREVIDIINSYILKEPLSQREIETITRDDAFPTEVFFKEKKFLHASFGDYLIGNVNIGKINSILHIYKDGLYTAVTNDLEKVMIEKIPVLKSNQRQEVLKYVRIKCQRELRLSDSRYIGLKSKIYDVNTNKLLEYGPEFVLKNKIMADYDPNSYDETTDKVLNKISCEDANIRSLLEEMIGYCLYRRSEIGTAFILTEDGSNGKSTVLKMIKNLLGENNCSSLEPQDLNKRFINTQLFGKLANLGDDISNNYIENSSILKKLITGEPITVENKGELPFDLYNYAKMIFCANEIPRINDSSSGLMRRLLIIPFRAKFSPSDPDYDPFIIDKLTTPAATAYLLKLAIEGLKRLLSNRAFTCVDSCQSLSEEYEQINNPVVAFVNDGYTIVNQPVTEVYHKYQAWCHDNGVKPVKKDEFGKKLASRFRIRSKQVKQNGKNLRLYVQDE